MKRFLDFLSEVFEFPEMMFLSLLIFLCLAVAYGIYLLFEALSRFNG